MNPIFFPETPGKCDASKFACLIEYLMCHCSSKSSLGIPIEIPLKVPRPLIPIQSHQSQYCYHGTSLISNKTHRNTHSILTQHQKSQCFCVNPNKSPPHLPIQYCQHCQPRSYINQTNKYIQHIFVTIITITTKSIIIIIMFINITLITKLTINIYQKFAEIYFTITNTPNLLLLYSFMKGLSYQRQ